MEIKNLKDIEVCDRCLTVHRFGYACPICGFPGEDKR